MHDSQEIDALLQEASKQGGNKGVWADSAYRSQTREDELQKNNYNNHICEKGMRGKPLSQEQKAANRQKSKIRAKVEHVFGAMEHEMAGLFVRTIGLARAKVQVGLKNLAYNLKRVEVLMRNKFFDFARVTAPKTAKQHERG